MPARSQANTQKARPNEAAPEVENARIAELIVDYCLDAIGALAPTKVEEIAFQWLSKKSLDPDDPASLFLIVEAFELAGNLLLFMPSLTGATPIDRLIRQRRAGAGAQERMAMDALAKARFRLLRLNSRAGGKKVLVEDLASGEILTLFDQAVPAAATGVAMAARLAPLPDGSFVTAGPLTPLDDEALAEGLSFARPGKGLSNPQRCAGAVYRHVVRHGVLRIEGLNAFPGDLLEAFGELQEEDDHDDLDRLAHVFAAVTKNEQPSLDDMNEARRLTSYPHLFEALHRSVLSRQYGRADLGDAFSRLAFVMMETFERRAAAGAGDAEKPLEFIAREIDRAVLERQAPPETRSLFEELCRRLGASARSNSDKGARGEDLTRVLQLIQALRAKTVDQGCTEQEALASARKVAELLDRYGLSLGEVEMREQACEGASVDTGRRRRGPLDDCVPAIAMFCDCKVWSEKAANDAIRYVFFGLPADVEAAHYLYDLIDLTFVTETARFTREDTVRAIGRRDATRSFQIGLAHGICDKLRSMKAERDAANRNSSGRDLVPLKASVIEEELEKLGLDFHSRAQRRKRLVQPGAYEAGREAGRNFEPRRGVEAAEFD